MIGFFLCTFSLDALRRLHLECVFDVLAVLAMLVRNVFNGSLLNPDVMGNFQLSRVFTTCCVTLSNLDNLLHDSLHDTLPKNVVTCLHEHSTDSQFTYLLLQLFSLAPALRRDAPAHSGCSGAARSEAPSPSFHLGHKWICPLTQQIFLHESRLVVVSKHVQLRQTVLLERALCILPLLLQVRAAVCTQLPPLALPFSLGLCPRLLCFVCFAEFSVTAVFTLLNR